MVESLSKPFHRLPRLSGDEGSLILNIKRESCSAVTLPLWPVSLFILKNNLIHLKFHRILIFPLQYFEERVLSKGSPLLLPLLDCKDYTDISQLEGGDQETPLRLDVEPTFSVNVHHQTSSVFNWTEVKARRGNGTDQTERLHFNIHICSRVYIETRDRLLSISSKQLALQSKPESLSQ